MGIVLDFNFEEGKIFMELKNNTGDENLKQDEITEETQNDVHDGLFNDYVSDDTYHITRTEVKNYKDESNQPSWWVKVLAAVVVVALVGCFLGIKHKEATKYNGFYDLEEIVYEGETLNCTELYMLNNTYVSGVIQIDKDECTYLFTIDTSVTIAKGSISIDNEAVTIKDRDTVITGTYNAADQSITIEKNGNKYIFYKDGE